MLQSCPSQHFCQGSPARGWGMLRPQNLLPFLLHISIPKCLKAKLELQWHLVFSPAPSALCLEDLLAGCYHEAACHASGATHFCSTNLLHSLFFSKKPIYFLFEIYKKQLNRKSVRFHFFHQTGLVMSGVSALTTPVLWCSQPQELMLWCQTGCVEPCALSHALQGLLVL